MRISSILNQLEDKSGMQPLQFNEEGVLTFIFNEEHKINLEKSKDDRFLSIYGIIGKLPIQNREECMKSLLDANLFGYKLEGASIGLDPDSEEIILFKTFDVLHLRFDDFFEQVSHFMNIQQEWTNKIKNQEFQEH